MPELSQPVAAAPTRRVSMPVMPSPKAEEGKRLTVGRDIALNGEITACDVLIVEGRVEATLMGSRLIEIAESGTFRGNAEIDVADIAGRYEGDLIVREKLIVRATGRITGKIRYRKLEVEQGGELVGTVEVIPEPLGASAQLGGPSGTPASAGGGE